VLQSALKTDLNQISLTGLRAIVLIGLLIVEPRSLKDIKDAFIKYKIADESFSNDALRVDLNTIKTFGCEISRPCKTNDYKYILLNHPFQLKFEKDEILVLKKVYNIAKETMDIRTIIDIHCFFEKIAFFICDEEIREMILGISSLKHYDINLVKGIYSETIKGKILTLNYLKPNTSKTVVMDVLTEEVVLKNDKLYLYCFDIVKKISLMLNFKRIKAVTNSKCNNEDYCSGCVVRFLYKDLRIDNLENNEKILEETSEGYIVEGKYHNDFIAIQRMLYLGEKSIILEPIEIKNKIIDKLKEMRKIYE